VAAPAVSVEDTPPGDGYYVIAAVDGDGYCGGFSERVLVGLTGVPLPDLPRELAVTEVVPNPFNPRTTITYAVPRRSRVRVGIYDLMGRRVRDLVDGEQAAGHHAVEWDGRDAGGSWVAAGVYLVRVSDGAAAATAKVVLAK
jgi:hypothetical protein